LTTRPSRFPRLVRRIDELVALYGKHLASRVERVSVFGANESVALEKVFVDLTILEDRARPAANLQYWSLMDAKLRQRRQLLPGVDHPAGGDRLPGTGNGGSPIRRPVNVNELLRRRSKAVIAGAPGCGKSTLLRYLALQALTKGKRLPILLALKEVTKHDLERAKWRLDQLLLDKIVASFPLSAPEEQKLREHVRLRIAAGETIILLDGLDEVSGEEFFNDLCRALQQFSASAGSSQLLVSARPYALQARFDYLPEMEIVPLNPRQVVLFLEQYYGRTTAVQALSMQLQRPDLRDLASVPLLLTMLAHLHLQGHGLVGDRLELYRQIVHHLTNTLDREKMVDRFRLPDPEGLYKHGFLRHLAYSHLFKSGINRGVLTGDSIAEAAKDFCRIEVFPLEWAPLLTSDVKATPLLREVYTDAWAFVHPTLQEYLAATALAKRADCTEVFSQAYFDPVIAETELLPMALGLWRDDSASLFNLLVGLPESLSLVSLRMRIRSARYGVEFSIEFWRTLAKRLVELVSGSRPEETYYLDFVLEGFAGLQNDRLKPLISGVISQLGRPTENVRRNAVAALGWLGGIESVVALCEILEAETGDLVWTINEALARIGGEQALECVLRVLKGGNDTQRYAAAITIERIGDEDSVPDLIKCLNDESFLVRWAAVEALGRIGGSDAVRAMVGALKDPHLNVREAATACLGRIGSDEVEQELLSMLSKRDSSADSVDARRAALEALGWIGSEHALAAVLEALEQNDTALHISAVEALGRIGGERAIDGLIRALTRSGVQVAIFAAEELGRLGGRKALDALIGALRREGDDEERELVRAAAAEALGHIRGDEALAAIVQALRSDTLSVRARAVNGLKLIGGPTAIVELIKSLKDNEMVVRWRAVDALGRIGGSSAVAALLKTLKGDDNSFVRWRAAKALGEIGDRSAQAGLVEASRKDPEEYVRGWALAALEQLDGRPAHANMLAGISETKDIEQVRLSMAELLAQSAGPESVADLLAQVTGSDPDQRESAPEILARLRQETLSSGLLMALRHDQSCVRARAAELVGYYRRDRFVLDELRRLVAEDSVDDVREAAQAALRRIDFALTSSATS
jgi:HEAT repeat protein